MIKGGPKIINDGLVLCLDAHDAKSYAGEPTTNLSPNSDYSGASLDTINSGSNGGWGTTFDRWISEIEGPGERTVKAFHLKLTGSTGSAPNAEGDASLVSGITSQVASLTSGNSYRVSAWAKVIRANGSSTAQTSSNLLYLTGAAAIGSSSLTVNTTWTRISASFSISTTGSYRLYHYFYGVSVGDILVITEPQIELKSYNTPYVYSSRSATNGWVDRTTNNNDGTLVNGTDTGVSHYRDGQVIMPVANSYLDFDGSNDRVDVAHSTQLNNAKTWEIWINMDSIPASNTFKSIFQKSANWNNNGGILLSMIYGNLRFSYGGSWGDLIIESLSNLSTNTWYQVVGTGEDTGAGILMKGYLNGVFKNSDTRTGTFIPTNTNTLYLGYGNGGYMDGKIGLVRVYNGILTAAEVLSNYNATKGRF